MAQESVPLPDERRSAGRPGSRGTIDRGLKDLESEIQYRERFAAPLGCWK
jgi:hypothetical protein